MKLYTKPVITIDSGLAEGVYAASGAGNDSSNRIKVSTPNVINNWGDKGQASFSLDLSNVDPSQLTVVLMFNLNINSGWGSGANPTVTGNQLTLYWYTAPSSADITVEANGDITTLQCTATSYSNANS